tara:strand:+ start:536 stop:1141 length:606 start_codon:yes stop_codon:yes gene_type:complete
MFIFLKQIIFIFLLFTSNFIQASSFEEGLNFSQNGDFKNAFIQWHPLAKQGNIDAQFQIGLMYSYGNGVKQDYFEALKWHELAGNNGNRTAQLFLGDLYFDGENIPQDFKKAKKWYSLSADLGDEDALIALGRIYEKGLGVSIDKAYSYMWFNIAAQNGCDVGVEESDRLGKTLKSSELKRSKKLMKLCSNKNYKNCFYLK